MSQDFIIKNDNPDLTINGVKCPGNIHFKGYNVTTNDIIRDGNIEINTSNSINTGSIKANNIQIHAIDPTTPQSLIDALTKIRK